MGIYYLKQKFTQIPLGKGSNHKAFFLVDKNITDEQSNFLSVIKERQSYKELIALIDQYSPIPIYITVDFTRINKNQPLGTNGLRFDSQSKKPVMGIVRLENAFTSRDEDEIAILNELSEILAQVIQFTDETGEIQPYTPNLNFVGTKDFQILSAVIDEIKQSQRPTFEINIELLNKEVSRYSFAYSNLPNFKTEEEARIAAKLLISVKPYADFLSPKGSVEIVPEKLQGDMFGLKFKIVESREVESSLESGNQEGI